MRRQLVVFAALAVSVTQARNYDVVLESVEGYVANPEYVGADSFLRIRRTDKSSLPSMSHCIHIIKEPPTNSTTVEAIIYEKRDNQLVPSWLKYKNNFCEYVNNEKRPIFDALAKLYHFTCPFTGLYKVDNWRPDDHLLPPVLPGPDRMMFGIRISTDTTNILKYGVVFQVDRSKAVRGGGRGPGRGKGT